VRGAALLDSSKPTWTTSHIDAHDELQAVSCPSASLCVAVDDTGHVVIGTHAGRAG
jgi:hypothetical protein